MKKIEISLYEDIDWDLLWQNSRAQKSWKSKGPDEWDKKADGFAERTLSSPYVPLLLSRLPLEKTYSVLDVGCGPGTLALPLAKLVRKVIAMDYSPKMLEILNEQARARNINNIETIYCSWEQDWIEENIPAADIALASRSMNVADLSTAIDKLNAHAKKYVVITDRIAPSPFDPDAFAAIGRTFNSGPDYIFTLNFLYAKGIHPHVEVLELEQHAIYQSMEEALLSYQWMFKELTEAEMSSLKDFLKERVTSSGKDGITIHRTHPPRWAMIWWEKQ